MGQSYSLSAGTLLYALRKLHKTGIYGVPDVMPRLSDAAFPVFAQRAEMELIEKKYGILNFDGDFTIEESFAKMLGGCADCRKIVGVSLHRDGKWHKLTFYPEAGAVLERTEDYHCALSAAADPFGVLVEELHFSEIDESVLREIAVDTDSLEKRSREALREVGSSESQTDLIFRALNGTGGYARISRVEDRRRVKELLLFYGEQGILTAEPEYTQDREILRFTPISAKILRKKLSDFFDPKGEEI